MDKQLLTISGVRGFIDNNGTAQLNLEDCARGLGFMETKGNYIRWQRVEGYLAEFKFSTCGERPEFIPENIFYRLAMKAKNKSAEDFQALVADEILPSIRKHGAYLTPAKLEEVLLNPDTLIKLATQLKEEQEQRKVAQLESAYKSEVIQGLNRELSLADMRQVLNRIVRKVPNYQARWAELYRQFEMKYHMSLNRRINKSCSKLDYIEHSLDMLPELFDIASKLYEGEVRELVQEIYGVA